MPNKLKGFEQHGVVFAGESGGTQMYGTCPFCSRIGKFFVNREVRTWDCKVCGRAGNFEGFLKLMASVYQDRLRGGVLSVLAKDRGLRVQTLRAWGVGWSGAFYAIPVSGNPKRVVTDIKRFTLGSKSMSTTGGRLSFIMPLKTFNDSGLPAAKRIWITEGEWDGMALWECLDGQENVWAVPGAGVLPNKLLDMLYDKEVVLVYDHDIAGSRGARKAGVRLMPVAGTIRHVAWPKGSPDGFDFRDFYRLHGRQRGKTLHALRQLMVDGIPPLADGVAHTAGPDQDKPAGGEGVVYPEVERIYKRWLHLYDTSCLDILFGAVFAHRIPGDPVWLFLVAPPGGMKTELLLSISKAPLVVTMSSLTPHSLISGANYNGNDPSLIPRLNEKVLVIKDFTSILSMNPVARDDIFGVLRDAYDGKVEKVFGTVGLRRYESHFGVLAGTTPAIEALNNANVSLGERFLKAKVTGASVTDDRQSIRRALQNITHNSAMRSELEDIGTRVLNYDALPPNVPEDMLEKFVELAKLIATLRGVVSRERYTRAVIYKPMAEVGTRLGKQLCKLAMGIGMYRMERVISDYTYRVILRVGRDTIPDKVEEVVRQLYWHGEDDYLSTRDVAILSRLPEETINFLLQDLTLLRVVERQAGRIGFWRLEPAILEALTYLEIFNDGSCKKKKIFHK